MIGFTSLKRVIFVALCFVALGLSSAWAVVIYVDCNAPGPTRDGLTWPTAYLTIQQASAVAKSGDDVWVAAGTYHVVGTTPPSAPDGVALYGGFPSGGGSWESRDWVANQTIFSACFAYVPQGTSTRTRVDGFTVTGYMPGIYIYHARPTIINNTVKDGRGYQPSSQTFSAIHAVDSAPIIRNNIVTGNLWLTSSSPKLYGGGIAILGDGGGAPLIEGNVITNNTAYNGGGIYCKNAAVTIRGNTITGNHTPAQVALVQAGGILHLVDSSNKTRLAGYPRIENNTISGNDCYGVGVENGPSTYCQPDISGNTISANGSGGVILARNVTGNTITGNGGPGVFQATLVDGNEIGDNADTGVLECLLVTGNHIYRNTSVTPHVPVHRLAGGVDSLETEDFSAVTGNTIEDNVGGYGGGVSNAVLIAWNTIRRNTAVYGGGIYIHLLSAVIRDNYIEQNTAEDGGGVYGQGSIEHNTIVGNSAARGGGLYMATGWWNTITDNMATEAGGGVYGGSTSSSLIARNTSPLGSGCASLYGCSVGRCTIVDNIGPGGAVAWLDGTQSNTIESNIVAYNESGLSGVEPATPVGNNCVYGNTLFDYQGFAPGIVDLNVDPLFVDLVNGDYHISGSSPCVDAAVQGLLFPSAAERDMDDQPRYVDGNGDGVAQADIGADEYLPGPYVVTAPAELFVPGWSWFSIPLIPDGSSDASAVLGFNARNRLFGWDIVGRTYTLYADDFLDLALGAGYLMFLDATEQHTPSYAGTLPSPGFEIPLTMGWSWIGVPWPADVSGTDILVRKGNEYRTADEDSRARSHPGWTPWLNWNWVTWDSATDSPVAFWYASNATLYPWYGYRVWANTEGVTIIFP